MVRLTFTYLILLVFLSGCSHYGSKPDLPCPDKPSLIGLPEDLQLQMPPDAVWIVTQNQLSLKAYAKKLETRAGCGE